MAVEGHGTASVGLAVEEARWLAAITVGVMLFAFACATGPEPDAASQLMAATVTPSAELSDTHWRPSRLRHRRRRPCCPR